MLSVLFYKGRALDSHVDANLIDRLLEDREGLLWVDLEAPTENELTLLEREFRFHPLAVEDIRQKNQRPKLERYGDYVYLVLYHLTLDDGQRVHHTEVDIVVGPNYVVTVHSDTVPGITALRARCQARPELFEPHPLGFLVYHLADGIVDEYFPLVDILEERLSEIEERALTGYDKSVLAEIFALRKDVIEVRHVVDPSRDVFNVLARRDESFLDTSTTVYFTDVYDHLLRISSRLDGVRELASAALETHLSVQSNALNVTVERLTAVTLVLMVVTLVTGFCGMNVGFPGRDEPLGLAIAVTSMVVIGLVAFIFARRRDLL